jgi:two-component system response regulator YesN
LQVLIVDDEMYSVMGIKDAINWDALGVSAVFDAYNMREAVKIFQQQEIQIMISDIEMPKNTGIELLEWVNENSPNTETIFLTAHDDFRFMQRAVQLSSFDYMMKPVEYEVLEEAIRKAILTVNKKSAELVQSEQYKPYYELWNKKKTLLSERFWYDLLSERIVARENDNCSLPAEYGITLKPDDRLLPVIVSVENWKRELSTRDEEVMEYAIRQSSSELLIADSRGEVVQTKNGVTLAILYFSPEEEFTLRDSIGDRCNMYIDACSQYLNCTVSCYIGEPVRLHELTVMYKTLLSMEYNNLSESNQLNWLCKQSPDPVPDPCLPDFTAWALLLENGKEKELVQQLRNSLQELASDRRFGANALQAYYQGFLQMIHYLLQKKGLSAHQLLQDTSVPQIKAPPRTLEQMEEWGINLIQKVYCYLFQEESVIPRLKAFIADHLSQNVTREMLAEYVHLNPAYLSRLFKKEVGMSITDYLLNERMRIAKALIVNSTMPISEIAQSIGYSNFSYFSKMFKRVYQANPQQFRKLSGSSNS